MFTDTALPPSETGQNDSNELVLMCFKEKSQHRHFFVTCFFSLSLIKKQLQMFFRCSKGEPTGHPFNLKTID